MHSEIENLLLLHNISAMAYHGGNGVNCSRVIQQAKLVFPGMQELMMQANNAKRCNNEKIMPECALYCNICLTLHTICGKLRLKHREPEAQDYTTLQQVMVNLHFYGVKFTLTIHLRCMPI
jgi:hypothetical protein